jgi:NAD-specific glutamate dehydrogenase
VANALVNGVGATFVLRLRRDTGVDVAGAVRAWAIAWRLVDGAALARAIDAEAASSDGEIACRCALEAATARAARWIVGHADATPDAAAVAAKLGDAIAPVRAALPTWLAGPEAEAFAQRRAALAAAGLGEATAGALAAAEWTAGALDVVAAAEHGGLTVAEAGRRYFGLAAAIDFPWILARLADASSEDRWERDAVAGLVEDVHAARRRLVAGVPDALPPGPLGRVQAALHDLRAAPRAPLAALLVLVRELRRLADLASDPLARREQGAAW